MYDFDTLSIGIDPSVPDVTLSVLHELGHHLDLAVLSDHQMPASASQRLSGWHNAVVGSHAVSTLFTRFTAPFPIGTVSIRADPDDLMYLLEVEELFARSYSQYIAVKSGDTTLINELRMSPTLAPGVDVLFPEQWEPTDFALIRAAFDELMEVLRWAR